MSEVNKLTEGVLSKLEAVKFNYTWKIAGFQNWPRTTTTSLTTPELSTKIKDKDLSYSMTLAHDVAYPRGSLTYAKDESFISILFTYDKKLLNDLNLYVKISVYNNNAEVYKQFQQWNHLGRCFDRVSWSNCLEHSAILNPENKLLSNDTLTIKFEFLVPLGIDSILKSKNQLAIPNASEYKIISDLENLFKNEKFSDLTVTASCGRTFRVHKLILSARSNVFAAMFENEMVEKSQNAVNISDIDGKIMHELLSFIYTGKINSPSYDNAIEFLPAADKYEIDDLKRMCESIIRDNINVENVVEVFLIANLHSAAELKNECLDFMRQNQGRVLKSAGFQTLVKKFDPVLSEILQYFGK